jgi:sialic acid synthase SpsE
MVEPKMKNKKTEIIAEIGQNHNGDIKLAEELINAAKASGAEVAKFQLYDAKALFPPKELNPWFDYNCQTELSRQQVRQLAEICDGVGIEFMASVFDVERVAWLEEVGVKRYKIASRSVRDEKLIAALVNTGKPLLVSLGMWDAKVFPTIHASNQVDFLYCVSKYPTPLSDLHLAQVDFTKYEGFSDHSIGTTAACAAFVLGARIVEKHLTTDKKLYGPDHEGSMTPEELAQIHRFREEWEACR